jgi:hypothetical protein
MSLLGYDNNDKTLSGDVEIYATNVYATNLYDGAVNVGDTLITLQDEIDALQAQINSSGTTGYYGVFGSTNNPNNPLAEKKLYFSQTIQTNGFSITGGTGLSATRITAANAGVYSIYYRINYQKINATTAYAVRIWLMKNGVDVDYSTVIQTLDTTAQFQPVTSQFIVSLAADEYVEVVWLSANANASSDVLDFQGASAPYPQVSSQFVAIQQVANTDTGLDVVLNVASTNTLPAGSSASVVDTTTTFPTYIDHSLVFNIPKGDKGDTGAKGDKGDTGNTGAQGAKGDKGDTGDTNATAIAALALATTAQATALGAVAGVVALNTSQSAQDVIIASHTTEIGLQGGRITALEVVTEDQSWGALSGTTFSRQVHITNTGASVGSDAVFLSSDDDSTFLYGLSASAPIISSAGTSQFSSLLVNTVAEITNDLTITNGELYVTRNALTSTKKIVLYDNTTGNDYDYLGFWTDSGTASKKFLNAEIDGVTGSAFQWYYGNGLGSARTLAKYLSSAEEIGYTPSAKFLKSSGASQEINLVRDTPNNIVSIDMLGDTAGLNTFDGQIIQEQGNGVDDNTGTMTIQSGGIDMFGLTSGVDMTGLAINITATTNDMTLTSAGLTSITSAGIASISSTADSLLLNGNTGVQITSVTGAIDLDSGFGVNITATTGDVNITSTLNEIQIVAYEDLDLTSQTLNVNITSNAGAVVLGAATTVSATSTDNMTFTSTGGDINIDCFDVLLVNCGSMNFNSTGGASMNVASTVNITSSGGAISFNAGAGQDFRVVGCDQCFITSETLTGVAFQHNSAATTSDNMRLIATGGYDMRIGEGSTTNGLVILGVDSGTSSIDSNASSLTVRSDAVLTLRGDTSVTTTSATNINATGGNATNIGNASSTTTQLGTVNINATGASATNIGNASSTTTQLGTVNINTTGSASTTIGKLIGGGNVTVEAPTLSFRGDFKVAQVTYSQPFANNTQLGYTDSATTLTDPMSNTLTARSNFSLPSAGVWLIVCGYEWRTNTANTVEAKQIILSETSGGSTPAAYGLQYYEEINDAAGAAGGRQTGTIMGVFTAGATTTTIYVNARSQVSSGTNTEFETNISWTRIG